MASRTANTLMDTFTLLEGMVERPQGMTVGEMVKAMNWVTRGQMLRMLVNLKAMGFVYSERVSHGRTGKDVYRVTELCAIHCASISRTYTEKN